MPSCFLARIPPAVFPFIFIYFGAPTSISCHFIYSSMFCHPAKINGNKGADTSEGNRPRGKNNGVDFGIF